MTSEQVMNIVVFISVDKIAAGKANKSVLLSEK